MNYKIRVANEAESKEAQGLFFELGYVRMNGEETPHISPTTVMVRAHKEMGINFVDSLKTFEFKNIISRQDEYILITILQLRDMVVLKRNNVGGEPKYDPEDIGIAKGYDLDEIAKEYKLRDRCEGETDEEYRYMLEHCIDLENYIAKETLNDKVASAEVARQEFIGVPFSDLPEFNFGAIDDFVESNVEQTLSDRESTYGSFKDVAVTTRNLMNCIDVDSMSAVQQEAMHMICSKLARIANGDPYHVDSWHDIAGYASLVVKNINGNP